MNIIKRVIASGLLLLVGLLIPELAIARTVTVTWADLPTTDCGGDTVAPDFYTSMEIWIDSAPITSVNETTPGGSGGCTPEGGTPDVPPTGATRIIGSLSGNSATFDLAPGLYWIRLRLGAITGLSNFSNQINRTVPQGDPRAPFLIELTF